MRRDRFVPISICLRRAEIREELSENGEATSSDSTYIRRLEGGLFTLQTLDYILAWLIMEDDGVRNEISFILHPLTLLQIRLHVIRMLSRKNQSVNKIVETLRVHYDNLQDEKRPNDAKHHLSQREIIQGLIAALEPSQENT
jgi:beta-catenin-like protein 1